MITVSNVSLTFGGQKLFSGADLNRFLRALRESGIDIPYKAMLTETNKTWPPAALAAQIKAVADKVYPGLVKDIYIGKGSYNQDLMSQAVLLEFGTHKSDKNQVLASTAFMADVLDRTLYGGVTGAAGDGKSPAEKNTGGVSGAAWLAGLLIVGALVYAFAATGDRRLAFEKFKSTFREMTGGLLGGHRDGNEE